MIYEVVAVAGKNTKETVGAKRTNGKNVQATRGRRRKGETSRGRGELKREREERRERKERETRAQGTARP